MADEGTAAAAESPDPTIVQIIRAGGLVLVVIIALLVVGLLAGFGMFHVADGEESTLLTSAFGVIGTLVGAYTGVRVGATGAQQAAQAVTESQAKRLEEQSIRLEETIAASPKDAAQEGLERADKRIAEKRSTEDEPSIPPAEEP
jgi:cytochrome c-type biogenesis protein CcmH/NrfG